MIRQARYRGYPVTALTVLVVLMLCGCRTVEYVPVERVTTDTLFIMKHQRDSIWLHDSTSVSEKQNGDTIYLQIERWHTKYKERAVHDTTYVATHDTVPAPYPEVKEVARDYTWWDRTRFYLLYGLIIAWLFLYRKKVLGFFMQLMMS